MKLRDKYGNWVCVAGAGEGLGEAFAEGLAKRGFNLILIDHKKDLIDQIKGNFESDYRIEVITLHIDLAEKGSAEVILDKIQKQQCRFLIYNAAYGPVRPFLSNTTDELDRYLNVNIGTQLHLIHPFIKNFPSEAIGILMISSLAGFRGTQFVIPYAATKAFIWNMAEGLYYEFKDTKLDITVCVAGATNTPNFRSTNPAASLFTPKARAPRLVAEEALQKFGKKLFVIPGTANKIAHFVLNRLLPRKLASTLHNFTMKKMYG